MGDAPAVHHPLDLVAGRGERLGHLLVDDERGAAVRERGAGRPRDRDRVALTGSLAAGAYLVLSVEMQNGAPDGLALVDTTTKQLLDALSYEGEIRSATIDGQVYDLVEGTALPATVADSNAVDGSLSRLPDS